MRTKLEYIILTLIDNIAFTSYCNVRVPSLQMPNVDEPKEIVNKLKDFMEQYKKDNPGPSKGS